MTLYCLTDEDRVIATSETKDFLQLVLFVRTAGLSTESCENFGIRPSSPSDVQPLEAPIPRLETVEDLKKMPTSFPWFERYTEAELACLLLNLPIAPDTIAPALQAYNKGLLKGLMQERELYAIEVNKFRGHPEAPVWELLSPAVAVFRPQDLQAVAREYDATSGKWPILEGGLSRPVKLILKPPKVLSTEGT